MLYSNVDRRSHNNDSDAERTDPNLTLAQIKDYIFEKHVYRIPLSLIVHLGLVNVSFKTNARKKYE